MINHSAGGSDGFGPLDITQYLQVGENLIAVKAQNLGGPASLAINIFAVPEPSSSALAVMSLLTLLPAAIVARRKKASRT